MSSSSTNPQKHLLSLNTRVVPRLTHMKRHAEKGKSVKPPTRTPEYPRLLRDMPLEVRTREAYSPLYLKRYE